VSIHKSFLSAILGIALFGCSGPADDKSSDPAPSADSAQPEVESRRKALLNVDGLRFRDLNDNDTLDAYEDWRLPIDDRVADLLGRMSAEEKAGMMVIPTLTADEFGALPDNAHGLIHDEHITRFIFRNAVVPDPDPSNSGRSGAQITPRQAATYTNAIQEVAEQTRLGIPVLFKSNARNHYEQDPHPGINLAAGSFSTWPKEAGLAATRDLETIRQFGEIMRQEWSSIGLRGMYGYMADLATEPRWFRVHETFTEDADLASDIIATLVETIQGERLGPGSVALTIKHFPGGGPQEGGGDPHYWFGRNQAYPENRFDYHLKPFKAAIEAGASSIMPYYGIPVGQSVEPNDVGMAFSKGVVTTLLRDQLGFGGYVNSDSGIIGDPGANRAWGLGDEPIETQLAAAIDAGADIMSEFRSGKPILSLVESGTVSQDRLDQSVRRLLREQFELGLFEDPYVDPEVAEQTVGKPEFQEAANLAQRKSVVLLSNSDGLLPLQDPDSGDSMRLYTLGIDPMVVKQYGFDVVQGDPIDGAAVETPDDADIALIRVTVSNPVIPLTDPREPRPIPVMPDIKPATIFGGAIADELDFLAFSDMVGRESWRISPSLDWIKSTMEMVGPSNTILAIYFRQPYVIDEASGMRDAGAIIALFGADDEALMDVVTGRFSPSGKLPFALANSAEAIVRQAPDAPGYPDEDTMFPFGFGLTYDQDE
jgi:beta-glucosidase